MTWFVFYPLCDIAQPTLSCSHAWIMYFLFGVFSTLSFQNVVLSFIHYGLMAVATLYFGFGLPWYEILWHFSFGVTSGWLVISWSKNELSKALKIELNFFRDLSKLFRISLAYVIFFFGFYGVDDVIIENNHPYGVALAAVFSFAWILVIGSFFFCSEHIQATQPKEQSNYWVFWSQMVIAALLCFWLGFVPSFSGYYKSLIATCVVTFSLVLYADYHKPLELRAKDQ
jgi:hypothetical protein